MFNPVPTILVKYIRDGLTEQEHFGYVVRCSKSKIIEKIGEDKNYPFYLRSCAKPLQASVLIDYELDKEFDLTQKEIALCCASHAGEKCHTDIILGLLKKFGLEESDLKCGLHAPLSRSRQEEILLNNEPKEKLIYNNCSGKHAMMLGLCVLNGWDIDTYYMPNHPLQIEIKNKINELCDISDDYPQTKDGCGVPIFSMPLANIVKGYLNLFCDEKYKKIREAFINNPYLIGGENRTDTKIIQQTGLIAKVGAGGLCVVINPEIEKGFIVKIDDSNMDAREIVTADLIKNLQWGNMQVSHEIKTLHSDVVGTIETIF